MIFFNRHQNLCHHGGLVREIDILSRSTLDVDFGIPRVKSQDNLKCTPENQHETMKIFSTVRKQPSAPATLPSIRDHH